MASHLRDSKLPDDLGVYHEEILQLAKETRQANEAILAAKEYEELVGKMPLPKKIFTKARDKVQEYFHSKSGLSEKEKEQLTPFWIRVVGALSTFCFIAILVGFTVSSYNADQSTKYLSLDPAAVDTGSVSSTYRTCLSIPFSITGTYTMDSNGVWNGASEYVPGKGIYRFVFNSFEKSYASYKTFMLDVKSTIATAVVDGASKRNLAGNLAYMMSWVYKKSDTTVSSKASVTDFITFMADPSYVFDKFYKAASLGAATQQCKQTPSILYDRPSGTFLVQYDYAGYYASDSATGCCKPSSTVSNSIAIQPGSTDITTASALTITAGMTYSVSGTGIPTGTTITSTNGNPATMSNAATRLVAVNGATISPIEDGVCLLPPVDYGYKSAYDSSHFNLRYNIWTLTTAYAVNNGILPYGVLNVVSTDFTKSSKGCYALDSRCSSTAADTACTQGTTLLYTSATSSCSITVSDTKYFIEARMSAQWPGMDPVYCLVKELNSNSATACFIRLGNTFVLPYFNHMGISGKPGGEYFNYMQTCACSTPTFTTRTFTAKGSQTGTGTSVTMDNTFSNYKEFKGCSVSGTGLASTTISAGGAGTITVTTGTTTTPLPQNTVLTITCSLSDFYNNIYATTYGATDGYCSMFDLVHGFAFIKGDKYNDVLANWVKVIVSSGYSASQINEMATVAGFSALKQGGNGASATGTTGVTQSSLAGYLSPSQGINAFSWCSNFGEFTCMVYAMNTVDLYSQRINADNGVATSSSCNNEFSILDTAWASTAGTTGATLVPPTNLIQDYYECYNTQVKSVLVAFGSGSGSAGSLTPVFVGICVVFIAKFLVRHRNDLGDALVEGQHIAEQMIHDAEEALGYHSVSHKEVELSSKQVPQQAEL